MTPLPMSPTPAGQGVRVLVSMTANQNIWPRASWGASLAASEASTYLLQKTQELAIIGIRWESHAQSSFLAPEPTGSSQPPWQELIGRAAPPPHLPMAMHSCRIWPKGRRRLNWSCPSKERESYQGNGAKEERQREEGEEDSRPFLPCPASGRRGYHPP